MNEFTSETEKNSEPKLPPKTRIFSLLLVLFFVFIDLISFLIGVPEKILLLICVKGIILSYGIKTLDAKGSKTLFVIPFMAFC